MHDEGGDGPSGGLPVAAGISGRREDRNSVANFSNIAAGAHHRPIRPYHCGASVAGP
jgi:hypothetical protein